MYKYINIFIYSYTKTILDTVSVAAGPLEPQNTRTNCETQFQMPQDAPAALLDVCFATLGCYFSISGRCFCCCG